MPTYVYEREDGDRFEIVQKISDEPLELCPETGQKVKKIPSWQGSAMISGWSPGNQLRKEKFARINAQKAAKDQYMTTLPEYEKRIQENTNRARAQEIKRKI